MEITAATKAATSKTGQVEVQSKEQVIQSEELQRRGLEIVSAAGKMGTLWYDLVMWIRKHKVAPKLVSFELGKVGFKRARISELNRIAGASDKLFAEYEAKRVGFHNLLELARKEATGETHATPAAQRLLQAGSVTDKEL